ncbi:MAG: Ig-like domain-containing protein [Planctomycetes bacterium]|nr:Ig-like domain-containing protein [Planctomycetota bacterium]
MRIAMKTQSMKTRTLLGVVVGAGLVASIGSIAGAPFAAAKAAAGPLKVVDCDVAGYDDVFQNASIKITFSADVDPLSVDPAIFQVRERNATGSGFTKQVPGAFQVTGSVVHFYPRLPTNLIDPASTTGAFYGVGTPRDDANENAGLKANTNYQVQITGGSSANTIRALSGRRLSKTYRARFSTTPSSPKSDAFTIENYGDAPPPGFQYSNPSDKVASPLDQYAKHGGTRDVPSASSVTLFGNRVPVSFNTLRQGSNVSVSLTERFGDSALAKPIRGTPFVEQNFDGTRIVFKPAFPFPDRATYAMKLTKDVKDLTEQYDFRNNPERFRLRQIYEYLLTAQALSPGTPPSDLPDPPVDLIFDWPEPQFVVERGVLKTNILALGNAYPSEVDPRVMVLFSTRDEPVSNGSVVLEFTRNDGLLDSSLSTASYDAQVPGAASAILTIAGGSGANGDYFPVVSETINADLFPNRTINWRKVKIPQGVVVTIRGTRPATVKCFQFELDGEIRADGLDGASAGTGSYTTTPTQQIGGLGGPGGGQGGNSASTYSLGGAGGQGLSGVDSTGAVVSPPLAGGGGFGGKSGTDGTGYSFGGAGGGGGARIAGGPGASGVVASPGAPYINWAGAGGSGGAGSSNDALVPFAGGAGGGSGGHGHYYPTSYSWYKSAGAGAGGGGALLIQTAGDFTVGTSGVIRSRGGKGGAGSGSSSTLSAGPGGGGGGGSLLLRTTQGFFIANAGKATDVVGGSGGTQTGSYVASPGGSGGAGYVRTEEPTGLGVGIANASVGKYDEAGAGVPSILYTNWVDLGVDRARMVNSTQSDFILNAGGNDSILIEMQMAVEDPFTFGKPYLRNLTANQGTSQPLEVSQWTPVRIVDLTGNPAGAFGSVPGYSLAANGTDYIFPFAASLNDLNYKFFRVRITFQLDNTQSSRDPFPFVDRMIVNFQFNI